MLIKMIFEGILLPIIGGIGILGKQLFSNCQERGTAWGQFEFEPYRPHEPALVAHGTYRPLDPALVTHGTYRPFEPALVTHSTYRHALILCWLGFNFDGAVRLFTVTGIS